MATCGSPGIISNMLETGKASLYVMTQKFTLQLSPPPPEKKMHLDKYYQQIFNNFVECPDALDLCECIDITSLCVRTKRYLQRQGALALHLQGIHL